MTEQESTRVVNWIVSRWFNILRWNQQSKKPEWCGWFFCSNQWHGHMAGVRLCKKHYPAGDSNE